MITPCPAPKHAHPGQPVELGTCIGYTIEPGDRLGRLVAIRHTCRGYREPVSGGEQP